ncbi:MAG TPA: M20/M25/M40 family metallo-hydrolase [Planctomycetota bacterium]|nr:M20/M25/M40 family metallo-hydrolase [Planctomycetota bacterium]
MTLAARIAGVLALLAAGDDAADRAQSASSVPEWRPDSAIARAIESIQARDVEDVVRALVACGTRHTASESESGSLGIGAARRLLVERFREANREKGRLEVREDWHDLVSELRLPEGRARSANVIARLPGESKTRVVVVSGHYDSVNSKYDLKRGGIDPKGDAPGADDDASGTAVVVACARALARMRFDATIELAAHTAEEQGLLGSREHARALKQAGAQVEAAIANDIVGASRGPDGAVRDGYVRLFSPCPEGLDSPSRNLARHAALVAHLYAKELGGLEVRLVLRRDRYGRSGDHVSFEAEGFPGIRFTEPRETFEHQHQDVRTENGIDYGDLPEHVDFAYLARVARLDAALAAELASAPAPPSDVKVNGAVRNDTLITWTPAAEDDPLVFGYEAVSRSTTSAQWERSFFVGRSGRATVDVVLDDEVVGLRAVGRDGRRSVAVVPAEPRPATRPR